MNISTENFLVQLNQFRAPVLLLLGLFTGWLLYRVLFRVLIRLGRRSFAVFTGALEKYLRGPLRLLLPLILLAFISSFLGIPQDLQPILRHLYTLALIILLAWMVGGVIFSLRAVVISWYPLDVKDNLKARAVQTQINVLVKIALAVLVVITLGTILMTFERIRQVGFSLLASAGIAGIIVGFAAQRSLGTLLAGLQIAITQPIRLDDVVIVEGEWGRIEEITLTYVVIRIWDLRRLVVPITYFIQKPFQNWTRVTADLLGSVFLYVDYTVSVEELRRQLLTTLQTSGIWDGKVWALQVTNTTEKVVELRALMSAPDASTAWNLRCLVREKLLAWLQQQHPDSLPRIRAELLQHGAKMGDSMA